LSSKYEDPWRLQILLRVIIFISNIHAEDKILGRMERTDSIDKAEGLESPTTQAKVQQMKIFLTDYYYGIFTYLKERSKR
jgi:hypothetical protein